MTVRAPASAPAQRHEHDLMRAAHPVAYQAVLRVPAPIRRIPAARVVVVKDPALVREALTETERFSKTGPGGSAELWTPMIGPSGLLNMDGDAHRRLRRQLAPLFSPAFAARLAADALGPLVDEFHAELAAGRRLDVARWARRLSSTTVSRLIGFEQTLDDQELFRRASEITGFASALRRTLRPRQLTKARAIVAEITAHAEDAYRRGDEATVPGRMRALGLELEDMRGVITALVIAGTETLSSLLPRLTAILVDTGWLTRLAADPGLTDAVVAEGLRITTPSPVTLRAVARETTLGGVPVRPGDRLLLVTFAANRSAGELFDPSASPAASLRQLWFGAGPHFCIGAPLAMAEIRIGLAAIAAHPGLRIVSATPSRRVLVPAYRSLEVEDA